MNLLRAFEQLEANAVPIIRASENDSERERECAERLAGNALIDGILVSPCVNSGNGELFTEIARKKPIVLMDNAFEESNLPTVVFDYATAGREIGGNSNTAVAKKRCCCSTKMPTTVLRTSCRRRFAMKSRCKCAACRFSGWSGNAKNGIMIFTKKAVWNSNNLFAPMTVIRFFLRLIHISIKFSSAAFGNVSGGTWQRPSSAAITLAGIRKNSCKAM